MIKKKLTKKVYDCKANDLLTVVADVKSYEDFIPFCSAVDIYDKFSSKEREYFSACLFINFKLATENFTTKVVVNRKLNIISITGNAKPFRSLIAEWSFLEKGNFCEVTFSLDVSFTSYVKEKLVAISFEKIALNIINAFESRAKGRGF